MQGKARREDPHSLAPIQLESPRLERDLATMKGGQGRRMTFALLGTTLAMVGLLQWMKSLDGRQAYTAAANQLNELRTEQATRCELLNPQASQQSVRAGLDAESQRHQKAYGQRLATCSEALVVLDRELRELDVPLNMQRRVDEVRRSAHALNVAVGAYRSYLLDPKRTYDFAQATPLIADVANAWNDYEYQHRGALDALGAADQVR